MSKKSNAKLRDVLNTEYKARRGEDYFQPRLFELSTVDNYHDDVYWSYGPDDEDEESR